MEYRCNRIYTDIIIDGDLSKAEWKSAEDVALVDNVTGLETRMKTTVKLLWNNNFIYAGFHCEDDYVCATKTGFNDTLYEEDIVEILIDDNRDGKTYIEVEVNPLNAVLHYCIHNDPDRGIARYARIEKVIRSACVKDRSGKQDFDVELAIPLSEFITAENIPPESGDRWRFNIYRIDRSQGGRDEYSAWAPTGTLNFHLPHKFGELVFR